MITFKQFLAEIDHDDEVYNKDASNASTVRTVVDKTWADLPVKIEGYEAKWRHSLSGGRYEIALTENGSTVMFLELRGKTAKVPGGTLVGVVTESLSSKEEARGKGLAVKLYGALVKEGQVLFSSNAQTTGSRKLWEQLVAQHESVTFVLAQESAARWYINRAKEYEHREAANVLLTGPMNKLNDEAYASEETRWVIVPDGVDTLKKEAIEL
jgi:hypothetical protein